MKIPRFEQEKRAKTFWMAEKVLLRATDLAIVIILLRTLSHIYHYPWENFPYLVKIENIANWIFCIYLITKFVTRVIGVELKSTILTTIYEKTFWYPLKRLKNFRIEQSVYYLALKPLAQEFWCDEDFILYFALATRNYSILKKIKCPLSIIFLADIVGYFGEIAQRSFQLEQVAEFLKSWEIYDDAITIEEIFEEAVENTLLFESVGEAREFAQLLYYYVLWDGCNAVKIIDYDGAAIETAIELLDARYCQQGEICFLNCVENQNNFSF